MVVAAVRAAAVMVAVAAAKAVSAAPMVLAPEGVAAVAAVVAAMAAATAAAATATERRLAPFLKSSFGSFSRFQPPSAWRCLRGRPASNRSNKGLGNSRSTLATTPICQGMTR